MPIPLEGFEDYEDIPGAAEILSFHPEHVRKLIRRGDLKAVKWHNKWVIHRQELRRYQRAWIEARGRSSLRGEE